MKKYSANSNSINEKLKKLSSKEVLKEKFPNISNRDKLLDIINKHLTEYCEYIQEDIIPSFVFHANYFTWENAKKSTKIVSYLKEYLYLLTLPNQVETLNNRLLT